MSRGGIVCLLLVAGCRAGFERTDARPAEVDATPPTCIPGPYAATFDAVPIWATTYQMGDAVLTVGMGALSIDTGTTLANSVAGIRSNPFRFADLRFVLEVSEMLNTASDARAYMCIADCNNNVEYLRQQKGSLVVEVAPLGGVVALRPYDPILDRWWQVSQSGGFTAWKTSADGIAWTTLISYPTQATSDTAELWLGGWNNGVMNGGAVTFRSFASCVEP